MKSTVTSLLFALLAFAGGLSSPGSSATAADLQFNSQFRANAIEVTYYVIQVEYARPAHNYGDTNGHYGHGGHYGGYGRYVYTWVSVAETTDPDEAEFIYALFQLAEEQGVLDEVAPSLGGTWFPTRVRMITVNKTVEPAFSR